MKSFIRIYAGVVAALFLTASHPLRADDATMTTIKARVATLQQAVQADASAAPGNAKVTHALNKMRYIHYYLQFQNFPKVLDAAREVGANDSSDTVKKAVADLTAAVTAAQQAKAPANPPPAP